MRTETDFGKAFKAARRVSTPLLAVRTADQASAMEIIVSLLPSNGESVPVLRWDIMRGLVGLNKPGKEEAKRLLEDGDPRMVSSRPSDALGFAERVVVFIDEIEKAFAGTGTDLSGVKTEMTGTMLSWMQDREADGCIFIGPPGTAKSVVAKATGNSAGIPTIAFDLSAMQNSLVGASGERLRSALQIVEAVSQGRALFIATCNSITSLPPELRRRFTLGTFFFDLPSIEEREVIWKIYFRKYGVSGELPNDKGWTGAEIKECCRKAYRLNISPVEAALYIVPVAVSAKAQIETLRSSASGKFISASRPGIYNKDEEDIAQKKRRTIRAGE